MGGEVCSKRIAIKENGSSKKEITKNCIFLQKDPLGIQQTYSASNLSEFNGRKSSLGSG